MTPERVVHGSDLMRGMDSSCTYSYEPLRTRLYEGFIAACTCVCAGGIATFAVSGAWRYSFGVLTGVVTLWAIRRSFRVGLWANEQRVLVRNFWITREFAWSDVKGVFKGLLTMGVVPQTAWLFRLHSGRLVRVRATSIRAADREIQWQTLKRLAPSEVVFNTPDRW